MPGIEPGSEMGQHPMTTSVAIVLISRCARPTTGYSQRQLVELADQPTSSRIRTFAKRPLALSRRPSPHQREGLGDAAELAAVLFSHRLRGDRNSIPVDLRTYVLCTFLRESLLGSPLRIDRIRRSLSSPKDELIIRPPASDYGHGHAEVPQNFVTLSMGRYSDSGTDKHPERRRPGAMFKAQV